MFDPLHKWLGIPPDEQPPHHYRLLGIAIFEEDTDVIDAAADKQLAFLHDLTNGEYADQAEQLSNQVSAARLCLLRKEKRQAYDHALRSQLERSLPAATPLAAGSAEGREVAPAEPVVDVSLVAGAAASPAVKIRRKRGSRKSKSSVPRFVQYSTVLCVVALLLIAVGVQQGRIQLGGSPHESTGQISAPPEPAPPRKTATARSQPTELPPTQPTVRPNAVAASSQPPAADASTPEPSPSQQDMTGTRPSPSPGRSLGDLVHPGQSSEASQPIVKAPLPSESQLEEKMQLIRELYENEYRTAETSKQKIELAKLMHREGQETSEDPIGRFGLWRVARDIMTREGDFVSGLGIVANLDAHYLDVDSNRMSVETLRDSAARISDAQVAEFLDTFASVVTRCDNDERFDLAKSLCEFVGKEFDARISDSQRSELERVQAESRMVEDAFDRSQSAAQTLKESPDDPAANQTVGHYLCFIRGDWQAGFDYLRRGADATIREAAELESSGHASASEAIAIADAWYEIAESETGPLVQTTIRRHALDWYLTAQEGAEGLEQRKVEARIASLYRSLPLMTKAADEGTDPDSRLLSHRVLTSSESRRDFAKRKGNEFIIGMGARPDGLGEAQAGIELQGVEKLSVVGSASHEQMPNVDSYTKSGFVIDYHTPGGYAKRVFLGLGLASGREFTEAPPWGTARQPDVTTDIGRSNSYEIDLTRWAPSTWDGRCWFTIYMQNGGTDRSLKATVSW